MFDEKMQKGLFTFYWEANQKEKVMDEGSTRSQEGLDDDEGGFKMGGRIEEKQIRTKHHKTEKIERETYIKHQDFQSHSFAKDNKSLLVPHHVTLSPAIEHTSRDKLKKKESKAKYMSEQPQTKMPEQKAEMQEKIKNIVQRLHFLDQPVQCHKKTLVIDESQFLAKSSCVNTNRTMKPKKSVMKEHHQMEEKICSNHKLPMIKTPQESPNPSIRLPHLFGKHSTKKLKTCKQNYFIEKLFVQKHLSASNSIVNIGISSTDEYKIRWKKRKEEFLSLLTKNFSKEDSGVQ